MTSASPAPRFDIGRVISRLVGVLGRNLGTFLALSALLVGLPSAAVLLAGLSAAPESPSGLGAGIASTLVALVANAVLQGALIHGTVCDLAGKPASFGDSLGAGVRFLLPLAAIGLVSAIAIGFALLLFVVPGVLLWLAWMVAAPAEVMERRGVFGALGRSAELTRNHRGAILGLAVIYLIILAFAQGLANAFVAVFGGFSASASTLAPDRILPAVATLIVQTLTALVSSAGAASIYYELRVVKDGIGAAQLAAVFD